MTIKTEREAYYSGYTIATYATNGSEDLELLTRADTDFDGEFRAYERHVGEIIKVRGWQISELQCDGPIAPPKAPIEKAQPYSVEGEDRQNGALGILEPFSIIVHAYSEANARAIAYKQRSEARELTLVKKVACLA
jgi:hypothetical protein